jgi:hypothetical protein
VDPGTNIQTLVARGLWRPAITNTPQTQVFPLHPNGYKFADGHIAKLELLPKDSGTVAGNSYGRTSNNQANVTVENLELRLPVLEQPDSLGGVVGDPVTKFVPPGYTLAPGYPGPGYPRPMGASPLNVSLVPAYRQCLSYNATHGPPLAFPSCKPPLEESSVLTVGTPDANGKAARSIGTAKFGAIRGNPATPADEADLRVQTSITDVRLQSDLSDYTGELQLEHIFRITDRFNAIAPGGGTIKATMIEVPFPILMTCSATADPDVGGTCGASTTLDAVVPGAIKEGKRTIWEMGQVYVMDGGSDGITSTHPNTLFARQGIFVP